ncbi:hypothetical protein ACOSQ4_017182 [Xanthoceras sorbifolium]
MSDFFTFSAQAEPVIMEEKAVKVPEALLSSNGLELLRRMMAQQSGNLEGQQTWETAEKENVAQPSSREGLYGPWLQGFYNRRGADNINGRRPLGNAGNLNTVGFGDSKGAAGHREAGRTAASEAGGKVMDCSKPGAEDGTAIEDNVKKLKMSNWGNQIKKVKNSGRGKQVGSC